MRNITRSIFLLGVALVCMAGTMNASVIAQGSDLADHPVVGSWLLDTNVDDPDNGISLVVFTADGVYIEADEDGALGIGVWESTGENAGQMTFRFVEPDGMVVIRGTFDIAQGGETLTAEYTFEITGPDGDSTGQFGPGLAEGTRAEVEEMGAPEGGLEDIFGQYDMEPDASTEGTPVDNP